MNCLMNFFRKKFMRKFMRNFWKKKWNSWTFTKFMNLMNYDKVHEPVHELFSWTFVHEAVHEFSQKVHVVHEFVHEVHELSKKVHVVQVQSSWTKVHEIHEFSKKVHESHELVHEPHELFTKFMKFMSLYLSCNMLLIFSHFFFDFVQIQFGFWTLKMCVFTFTLVYITEFSFFFHRNRSQLASGCG